MSLSLFRFATPRARLWAFTMMGLARPAMRRIPDIGFWKLCGSGTGEGFTPVPNTSVWAILATWPDAPTARRRTAEAGVYRRFRARAAEHWTVHLAPVSARGAWAGDRPFAPGASGASAGPGPVAVLTRATIRPSGLLRFWAHEPAISAAIGANPDVLFKIGIGEVPWLHQVTFSIWTDRAAMLRFAQGETGPHRRAVRAVRAGGWFREELYARFRVIGSEGAWGGRDPLGDARPVAA